MDSDLRISQNWQHEYASRVEDECFFDFPIQQRYLLTIPERQLSGNTSASVKSLIQHVGVNGLWIMWALFDQVKSIKDLFEYN